MTRLRVQVEPVGSLRARSEVGLLQRARHNSGRPLLSGCGSYRHGLARVEVEQHGLRLQCRDAGDAGSAAALARQALSSLQPLHQLLPDRPGDRVSVEGTEVRIESFLPGYGARRVLDSVKALSPDGPASRDTVDFIECTGPEAIAAFDRGDLHATAPTSFEISRDRSSDDRFRRYQPDVFLLLLIGTAPPAVRRSIMLCRQAFRDRLATDPELRGQYLAAVAEDLPEPDEHPAGRPPELLYADYWPNATIAASLGSTLAEFGIRSGARPIPLEELRTRTAAGNFDLALVLVNGYAGQQLSIPLTLARAAALTQPTRMASQPLGAALAEALDGSEDGPAWQAVTVAALSLVPAIPLGRLCGGSLMHPALPDYPLAYGCVLPLEHYAGGCRA